MKRDLQVHKSEDFEQTIRVDKDYIDHDLLMQVRRHPREQEVLSEIVPTVDERGNIVVSFSSEDTKNFNFDQGVYDIRAESPGGKVSFPVWGSVVIRDTVTRPGSQ